MNKVHRHLLFLLPALLAACLPGPAPATGGAPTPPPVTAAASQPATPLPGGTVMPTDTALIELAPPTATFGSAASPQGQGTAAASPTGTPTSTPLPGGPMVFGKVQFISAVRDPTRAPNGSIATLTVEFSGSRPPYEVRHDGVVVLAASNGDGTFERDGLIYTFIHFNINKACGGNIVGTVSVTGGDNQTVTHDYYIADAPCT